MKWFKTGLSGIVRSTAHKIHTHEDAIATMIVAGTSLAAYVGTRMALSGDFSIEDTQIEIPDTSDIHNATAAIEAIKEMPEKQSFMPGEGLYHVVERSHEEIAGVAREHFAEADIQDLSEKQKMLDVNQMAYSQGQLAPHEMPILYPEEGYHEPVMMEGRDVNPHNQALGDDVSITPVKEQILERIIEQRENLSNNLSAGRELADAVGGVAGKVQEHIRTGWMKVSTGMALAAASLPIADIYRNIKNSKNKDYEHERKKVERINNILETEKKETKETEHRYEVPEINIEIEPSFEELRKQVVSESISEPGEFHDIEITPEEGIEMDITTNDVIHEVENTERDSMFNTGFTLDDLAAKPVQEETHAQHTKTFLDIYRTRLEHQGVIEEVHEDIIEGVNELYGILHMGSKVTRKQAAKISGLSISRLEDALEAMTEFDSFDYGLMLDDEEKIDIRNSMKSKYLDSINKGKLIHERTPPGLEIAEQYLAARPSLEGDKRVQRKKRGENLGQLQVTAWDTYNNPVISKNQASDMLSVTESEADELREELSELIEKKLYFLNEN